LAVERDTSLARRLEFLGYSAYQNLFRAMPIETASRRGAAWLAAIGPRLPHHRIILTNLRFAFPDLSEKARLAIARDAWANLGAFAAEFPHMASVRIDGDDPRLVIVNRKRLDEMAEAKTGGVLIGGHFANFESIGASLSQTGLPIQITYRPANNAFVDDAVQAMRRAYGTRYLQPKSTSGGMHLMRALKKGEMIGIMNDQKNNEGMSVPFFGVPAMTFDGPTRLARRFGCPLVPIATRRTGTARYEITVFDDIALDTDPDEEKATFNTIVAINRFIEDRIRENPADWFWVHRRWPKGEYGQ
jgi:Kdo2-lipid IVA lauroyltransferase/acyltransferase